MKPSQKALDNGWGWVLGVSGEECRVRSRPKVDHAALLQEVAELLGVSDPEAVPAAVQQLRREHRQALTSAATAWSAVHNFVRLDGATPEYRG
ncbi:hypothetical protein ACFC36_16230 [Streptomyces rubiginosohelvolus]|uniref:hypothetical protein n=1 Tax=Streptomyces rubiginosohelvolus TaxID=67362 RepID=UPI0035DB1451